MRSSSPARKLPGPSDPPHPNRVRELREAQLLTKAELARMAGISALTLSRIESGSDCRVDTKRKIILALGLAPADGHRVFGDLQRLVGARKDR